MPKRPIPTDIVIEMNKRGYNDIDIIKYLKQRGYTPVEMNDAFNAAKIKMELSRTPVEEQVAQDVQPPAYAQQEQYEEPVEESGDYSEEIRHLQVRIKEIENKTRNLGVYLENLQKRLAAKFQENSTIMNNLSGQVNALQQSFSKILEPLAHGVKVKTGMLDLRKKEESETSEESGEEVQVITETKEETKTTKRKEKKDKPGLEDTFKK